MKKQTKLNSWEVPVPSGEIFICGSHTIEMNQSGQSARGMLLFLNKEEIREDKNLVKTLVIPGFGRLSYEGQHRL